MRENLASADLVLVDCHIMGDTTIASSPTEFDIQLGPMCMHTKHPKVTKIQNKILREIEDGSQLL
jgi:hypothetical protein